MCVACSMQFTKMRINPEPRKILMTADTVGGVWSFAIELIRALEPHGIKIALATMGDLLTSDKRREIARLGNVELFESSYRLEWMDDSWDSVDRAGDWLFKI